jgi:Predicted transcriptional regulator
MKGIYVKEKLLGNGYVLSDVAKNMGIIPQNLQTLLSAEDIKTGVLENIAKAISKSIYFFFEEDALNNSDGSPFWNLPVTAGQSVADLIGGAKPDGYIYGLPGAELAENILPVVGTSMEPEISAGAIIGVRKVENWESLNTERIYLIITRDDRMIKRIEHDVQNGDILWCISPNYPRFKIYVSDIIEIQRVVFAYNLK